MRIQQRRLKAFWLAVFLAAVSAQNFFSPEASAAAQSLSADQLHGCWKQELNLPQRKAIAILCFRNDNTVRSVSMSAPGEGGEELFKWNITTDGKLVINRQTCGANIQRQLDQHVLFLDTCVYMGAWIQTCTLLDPSGFGCATKD
jgi:hypothetical protein